MISRVCGRTRRILRNSSTSSLPDVFSLVRMRSQGIASARARAAALSGACRIHQDSGFRVPVSTASTWGSTSTTRAVLTGNGRFSRCGTALIHSNHLTCTANCFSNLLSEIPDRLRRQRASAGRLNPRCENATVERHVLHGNPTDSVGSLTRPIIHKLAISSHGRQSVSAVNDLLVQSIIRESIRGNVIEGLTCGNVLITQRFHIIELVAQQLIAFWSESVDVATEASLKALAAWLL